MDQHHQTIRAQLTDDEWDAWAGVHIHHISLREAARQLGVPYNTHRGRYHRATRKLATTPNTPQTAST